MDFDDEGFPRIVGEEIKRRLDTGECEVLLDDVLWTVCPLMSDDISEVQRVVDSVGEIFNGATTDWIAEVRYDTFDADTVVLLQFGGGLAFLAFSLNEVRDRGYLIVGEADPELMDWAREEAVSEVFCGAGARPGELPSHISVDCDATEIFVRETIRLLAPNTEGQAFEAPEVEHYGPYREMALYESVDDYLDAILTNISEHGSGAELLLGNEDDAAPGMLLDELIRVDERSIAADLDRVETELRGIREELGDGDVPVINSSGDQGLRS